MRCIFLSLLYFLFYPNNSFFKFPFFIDLMFPHSEYFPFLISIDLSDPFVPFFVSFYFGNPIFFAGCGNAAMFFASVPETRVNEDDGFMLF